MPISRHEVRRRLTSLPPLTLIRNSNRADLLSFVAFLFSFLSIDTIENFDYSLLAQLPARPDRLLFSPIAPAIFFSPTKPWHSSPEKSRFSRPRPVLSFRLHDFPFSLNLPPSPLCLRLDFPDVHTSGGHTSLSYFLLSPFPPPTEEGTSPHFGSYSL